MAEELVGERTESVEAPPEDDVVQFWLKESDAPLIDTVRKFLFWYFDGYTAFYRLRIGANGLSVFALIWFESHAWGLHGKKFSVEGGTLFCAKVHQSRVHNANLQEDEIPNIHFSLEISDM